MLAEDDQPVDLSPGRMADPRCFHDLAATDLEVVHAPGCASAVQWIPRRLLPLAHAAFSTLLRRVVSNPDATADECGVISIALFATYGRPLAMPETLNRLIGLCASSHCS